MQVGILKKAFMNLDPEDLDTIRNALFGPKNQISDKSPHLQGLQDELKKMKFNKICLKKALMMTEYADGGIDDSDSDSDSSSDSDLFGDDQMEGGEPEQTEKPKIDP